MIKSSGDFGRCYVIGGHTAAQNKFWKELKLAGERKQRKEKYLARTRERKRKELMARGGWGAGSAGDDDMRERNMRHEEWLESFDGKHAVAMDRHFRRERAEEQSRIDEERRILEVVEKQRLRRMREKAAAAAAVNPSLRGYDMRPHAHQISLPYNSPIGTQVRPTLSEPDGFIVTAEVNDPNPFNIHRMRFERAVAESRRQNR